MLMIYGYYKDCKTFGTWSYTVKYPSAVTVHHHHLWIELIVLEYVIFYTVVAKYYFKTNRSVLKEREKKYETYTVLLRTEKMLNARIRSTTGTAAFIISSLSEKRQLKN